MVPKVLEHGTGGLEEGWRRPHGVQKPLGLLLSLIATLEPPRDRLIGATP
jgi:hypothetical protein